MQSVPPPTTCEGACTITFVADSAPITEEKASDLLGMFWTFVLALVVVWGVKQLLNFFTSDADH